MAEVEKAWRKRGGSRPNPGGAGCVATLAHLSRSQVCHRFAALHWQASHDSAQAQRVPKSRSV
jgi:hypothetical protein